MRRILAVLLFTLLAIKIAATLARGPIPIERDAAQYWRLSEAVMAGDLLLLGDSIAYRTPGYPWFLAFVRSISNWSLLTIVLFQGIMASASILIAGHIASRITNNRSAFLWTLGAALPSVSATIFAAAVLTETLFIFLLMLNLLAVMDYAKHDTVGRLAWVAVTFAITLLTRPIVLLLWIPHVLFLLCIHHRRRRQSDNDASRRLKLHHRAGHAAIALGLIALIVAPWLMRNHYLFGKPFLTEFVGRNIWIVTFQDGSGAGLPLPDTPAGEQLRRRISNVVETENWRDTWTVSNALVRSGLNDAEADQLMKRVAVDAMLVDKKTFAWKTFRRCVNFWRCAANDLPQGPDAGEFRGEQTWRAEVPPINWALQHRFSRSVAGNTILTVLIGLATLLLVLRRSTRPYGIWIALMLGYFSVVTGVLEIPNHRYRIIVEPLATLTIGAACAILIPLPQKQKRFPTVPKR